MEKLIYPACFYPCEEKSGYTVVVPDLPGCVSEGDTLAEAMDMAIDAASGWVLDEMEEGNPIPKASAVKDIQLENANGFVSILALDMDSYAEKYGDKAVRKNLTIPAWLNNFAERNGINFSKVLQNSLLAMYEGKMQVHKNHLDIMVEAKQALDINNPDFVDEAKVVL